MRCVQPRALPQPQELCYKVLRPRQRATGSLVHAGLAPAEWDQCKTWVIDVHCGVAAGLEDVGQQQAVPMGKACRCGCLSSDTTPCWLNLVGQC